MKSKEMVIRAVTMGGPQKVPLVFFNRDKEKSDIRTTGYKHPLHFSNHQINRSEWGFLWDRIDDTMGQPTNPPIFSWELFDKYRAPDPNALGRFDHIPDFMHDFYDKYLIGSVGISGFNMVTFLRGFENTMVDFHTERKNIEKLIDMVFDFEKEIIKNYGRFAFDAISFADDWGTQKDLMISPKLWREIFKPRYAEQFDLVHQQGMHVYFHSCGNILEIIPDLIELGVDILNLNQPDLFGIEKLGRLFGGKVCFNCPVDHQTVAIFGNKQQIQDYVKRLNEHLGCFNGGFIGYIEEYHSVGMTEENYRHIVEAFQKLRSC